MTPARIIRILVLSILVGLAAAKLPQAQPLYYAVLDQFDDRPTVSVLFIGNSRTFYNEMPYMVRKIADSAHSAKKYEITMYAKPGARLEDHWNDAAVQELLTHKWDYVVLQGGSSEQINETMNASFQTYGAKLAQAVKAQGGTPVLLVAWKFADDYYPQARDVMPYLYGMIQKSYSDLAQATGASSVNAGRVWEKVRLASPLPLTVDGNHPTMRASYLIALMFYRFFSGGDLSQVTFIPEGVSLGDAELLKKAAQEY